MSIPGSEAVEVPVLIVGAGPAGLALSVALSRYGVGHLVVERHRGTAHTPRAHIINQRTIEIFRHLGISDRFHAVATPQHLMASNLWVTTLAGLEVARSETWGTSGERDADEPRREIRFDEHRNDVVGTSRMHAGRKGHVPEEREEPEQDGVRRHKGHASTDDVLVFRAQG